jgi:hypothetical protein
VKKEDEKRKMRSLVPERIDRVEVCSSPCRIDATDQADHNAKTNAIDNTDEAGRYKQVFRGL